MIFYGTNSSRLKDGQLQNVTCPNCDTQTSMTYAVFGKYAYIYWIPLFPMGKVNVLECNQCKKTYKLSELPEQIKKKFELEKHTGIPFLHFSGLAIIALAIGYFSYSSSRNKALDAEYIAEPAIGDVYSTNSDSPGQYTTMKVTTVTKDSIYVVLNDYEIDKKSAIDEIDINANYTTYTAGYTKSQISAMFKNKSIFEVDRN